MVDFRIAQAFGLAAQSIATPRTDGAAAPIRTFPTPPPPPKLITAKRDLEVGVSIRCDGYNYIVRDIEEFGNGKLIYVTPTYSTGNRWRLLFWEKGRRTCDLLTADQIRENFLRYPTDESPILISNGAMTAHKNYVLSEATDRVCGNTRSLDLRVSPTCVIPVRYNPERSQARYEIEYSGKKILVHQITRKVIPAILSLVPPAAMSRVREVIIHDDYIDKADAQYDMSLHTLHLYPIRVREDDVTTQEAQQRLFYARLHALAHEVMGHALFTPALRREVIKLVAAGVPLPFDRNNQNIAHRGSDFLDEYFANGMGEIFAAAIAYNITGSSEILDELNNIRDRSPEFYSFVSHAWKVLTRMQPATENFSDWLSELNS